MSPAKLVAGLYNGVMTEQEMIKFERQLELRDWRYDASEEQFFVGARRLDWSAVQALFPGGAPRGLSAYQDQKRDEWRRQKPSRQDDADSGSND